MFPPKTPTREFPYQIEGKIGEGAMGEVFLATEPSLGRPVAIKLLRKDMLATLKPAVAREAMQRFIQEARAAASLSHPGITTIYRVSTEGATPYIAMEWLEGETLEALINREAPVEPGRAVHLIHELLDALVEAHEAGIVHRDLKPANLMLVQGGRLKITDFGVAHVDKSELVSTQAHTVLGTPLYASPEQIRGDAIDARSDLYSIGVVLYEMLTGQLPFDGASIFDLAEQMMSTDPAPPSSYNDSIPQLLDEFVLRALSHERNARWGGAREMLSALVPLVDQLTEDLQRSQPGRLPGGEPEPDPGPPVIWTAGRSRVELIAAAVQSWPSQPFGQQHPRQLLKRLLERPLHAPAFVGCARFGSRHFFIYDGLIYAAFDTASDQLGDLVYENLPEDAAAVIYPVPESYLRQVLLMLASAIHPPRVRHSDLDTSYVDLGKMVDKLIHERFSGTLRLHRNGGLGYLFFWQGQEVLNLLSSTGWPATPERERWRDWIDASGAMADVEERRTVLPAFSYREELQGFGFAISRPEDPAEATLGGDGDGPRLRLAPDTSAMPEERAARGTSTTRNIYRSDPMFSFLCWMLTNLPGFFAERDRTRGWKYLATWVDFIERARLHHALPRPNSRQEDFFDLVTSDGDGKVLHLADHLAYAGPEQLQRFADKVITAKEARIKTGDIGGAILIAREFSDDIDPLYQELIAEPEKTSLLYNLQNSFTKYEGFVRIGTTRGFHLLLVRESSQGFEPLLLGA